ncbi:MAG: metal ABC transporter permease [Clostridia bacterium]|nr:metal ABC transporter permease [Clostridia bacterium]
MAEILRLLSYPFISRALITGTAISFCAALLGVILVLKRYSMIGHGLADVAFCAVSLAVTLGLSPTEHILVTLPVVIIASFVIMSITKKGGKGDIAIGMVSTGALALGIIITRLGSGFNVDVTDYMFGSILASSDTDMYMSIILVIIVLVMFVIFYNRLFLITYDESFAEASGINVTFYQFLISFLTALTIVIGMRIMGTLLISSLIIFPAVTSRRIVKSFRSLILLSAAISVVCFLVGFFASYYLDLPTGASIVGANIVVCTVVTLCTLRKNS